MEFFIILGCACSFWALIFGIDACIRLNKIEKFYTDKHDIQNRR